MIGKDRSFTYKGTINGEDIVLEVKDWVWLDNINGIDMVNVEFELKANNGSCYSDSNVGITSNDYLYKDIIDGILEDFYDILPQNGTITLNI